MGKMNEISSVQMGALYLYVDDDYQGKIILYPGLPVYTQKSLQNFNNG